MSQFRKDLKEARKAEQFVFDLLSSLDKQQEYRLVNESPEYYHKGDILAIAADGTEIFIDVKCDSRIFETGRILCEEENYFFNNDRSFSDKLFIILCCVFLLAFKMYEQMSSKTKEQYRCLFTKFLLSIFFISEYFNFLVNAYIIRKPIIREVSKNT